MSKEYERGRKNAMEDAMAEPIGVLIGRWEKANINDEYDRGYWKGLQAAQRWAKRARTARPPGAVPLVHGPAP